MKHRKNRLCTLPAFWPVAIILVSGCTKPPPATLSHKDKDIPECIMMQEVCDEAMAFQKQFNALPEEERDDYIAVLNTFIEHCENARKTCKKKKR